MAVPVDASLVEREREIEALERLLVAARTRAGAGLLVEGPPGIGKSRLLATARGLAGDVRVLAARGSELERDIPFAVVRQLLEPVLMAAGEEERGELLAGAAALAQRVLEPDGAALDDGVREAAAGYHGLYWLTANLAARSPLLIVVDDAHWADLASLRWLAYLAQRLDGLAVGLLLGARPPEAAEGGELLDALASLPHVDVLHPRALSEPAVGWLIEQRLGGTADPSFVAACERVTGGNPFLVGELLGELAGPGLAPSAGNAAAVDRLSSRGVSRAALGRLRRLPGACRALAHAVVVLGDGVELAQAADLAGLDEDAASDAADALATAFVLERGRPLRFVHPLVRGSVYAELGAGERDRWHRRAAAALAAAGAPADRIAAHLLACDPRGDPAAVETLRDAARSAQRRGATEMAIAHLRRARREPPPPELRAHVDFELGAAELQAGAFGAAVGLLGEAAANLPAAGARGMAAAQLGGALLFTGQVEEAVAVLSRALDGLPDEERELGLRLQVLRNAASRASPAAWRRAQGTVERFQAAQANPPTTAAERLWFAELANRASLREPANHAQALARRALAGGALFDDPGPSDPMFYPAPIALLFAGALEEATGVFSAVLEWARRHGSVFAFSQAVHLRAYGWWARGALSEAEADAELALAHPSFMVRPGVMALLEVRLARGDVVGAEQLWGDTRMDDDRLVGQAAVAQLEARAHLRAALGRTQDALEDLLACGRLEDEWDIQTPAMTNWRSAAAGLLASLGQHDEARRLAREGVERGRRYGAARRLGDSLTAAGRLEQRDGGLSLLEEAVDVLERSPARLEHARALFELGGALRRAGRRADARAPLRDAIEVARVCGAEPLAMRAHDELIAAGARPRRDPIESRSQLTASELRVARLAAEGRTNRDIAQALFLTEKTIEVHLTSSYRKLDIGSRTQLARALPPSA